MLRNFRRVADADLAALLQIELRAPIDAYAGLKRDAGRLDFADLLLTARDLVRDHADVRADFQRRFTRIFVDEFQDTDPLQAEILLLLAADDPAARDWRRVRPAPGKLFIVGDPKQSIYRFRRADLGVYQSVKTQLQERGVELVALTTSFRAVSEIQRLVNRAFAPLMTGGAQGAGSSTPTEYVRLSPHRGAVDDQPAVVVLPVPRPYGARRVAASAIERSLPDAVGAFIDWLVTESGWRVTERLLPSLNDEGGASAPTSARVPVAARHVCLLFRRFESFGTDMTRAYVEALEARELPHLLVGGRTFHNREEVMTMRAALAAVEHPDDELSVFATLRGSLFAIEDAALLEYHHRFGRLHPLRVPAALGGGDRVGRRVGRHRSRPARVDRRGADRLAGRTPTPKQRAGRRDDRAAARDHTRARWLRHATGWRAGAGQRDADRRDCATLRGGRRAVVPRVRRAPRRRGVGTAGAARRRFSRKAATAYAS